MAMASTADAIRTRAEPRCILCNCPGEDLYRNLADRLFGTNGSWGFKKCPDRNCALIWLDPMPVADDLGKAYANYYTHSQPQRNGRVSALKQCCLRAQDLYVQQKFGYSQEQPKKFVHAFGGLVHTFRTEGSTTFLEAVPGGKLLDVGCGSGGYLASMRALGWEVEGLESDPAAVTAARQRGLNVHCSTLEERVYPPQTFDAVALIHVVEHLPDPLGTIRECARILKPGGKLLMFTPNAASLSHRLFKRNWRGLEPPRHLFLFSAESIERLVRKAGFDEVSIRPQVGSSLIYESCLLRRRVKGPGGGLRRNLSARLFARLLSLLEIAFQRWHPRLTDCVGVLAVRA